MLKRGKDLLAIEAKSSARVSPEHTKGLHAIAELRGLTRRLLVYVGAARLQTEDGIEIVPFRELLEMISEGRLWP